MSKLITRQAFSPIVGKCYDVHFGEITIDKKTGFGSARIRVEGTHNSEWVDLDTGDVLDARFSVYIVQAFEEIPCNGK